MTTALFIIYVTLFVVELILIIAFQFRFKRPRTNSSQDQNVSVLIAARNEALNLPRCLDALLHSDYDVSKVEFLIGDDLSDDGTWSIIQEYAARHAIVKGLKIEDQKDGLIAKGNVVSQLVDAAQFEKLLIIDADMAVSKGWLRTMSALLEDYDLISGYTSVAVLNDKGKGSVQYFDWAIVLHSMKAMGDLFKPISILGNNMGFNRKAYDEVGGFRALGPTDVEDLGLLRRFQKAGKSSFQYVGEEGSAVTLPQLTFREMLIQRCRWMNGVFTHHWLVGIPALFSRLWVVVCIIAMFLPGNVDVMILLYGFVMNALKFTQMLVRGGGAKILNFFSPFIISLLDTFALLRLLLVGKVSWKGRKFS